MNDDLRLHGVIGGGLKLNAPEQTIQIASGNSVKRGDLCTITHGTPLVTNPFIFEEESDILHTHPLSNYGFTSNELKMLEIDATRLLVTSLNSTGSLVASVWSLNADGSVTPRNGVVLYTKPIDSPITNINLCVNTAKSLIVFIYRASSTSGTVLQQLALSGTAFTVNAPYVNTTTTDAGLIEFLSSETELIAFGNGLVGYGLSGTSFIRRGYTNAPSGFGNKVGLIKSRVTKEVICIGEQQTDVSFRSIKLFNIIAWNNFTTLQASPSYTIASLTGSYSFRASLLQDGTPLNMIVSSGDLVLNIVGNSTFTFANLTSNNKKNTPTGNIFRIGNNKVDIIGTFWFGGNGIIEHYGVSASHAESPQVCLSSMQTTALTSVLSLMFNNNNHILYFDTTNARVKKLRTIGINAIATETKNSGTVKVIDLRI